MHNYKIPIETTAITSLDIVRAKHREFFRIAAPLAIMWLAMSLIIQMWETRSGLISTFGNLAIGLVEMAFAVLWYRLVFRHISGAQTVPSSKPGTISSAGLLWRSAALILIMTTILIPPTILAAIAILAGRAWFNIATVSQDFPAIVMTGMTVAMFACSPLVCRILPYYAAIARGRNNVGLRAAWQSTRGNGLRLWLLMMRLGTPWWLLLYGTNRLITVYMDSGTINYTTGLLVRNTLASGLSFMAIAVVAAGLAIAIGNLQKNDTVTAD